MLLQILNLTKKFDKNHVLENISFNLEKGKVICFLGPSGCGKSTLLRIIAGIESFDSGEITNNASHTAFIFQEGRLLPWLSIAENIELVLKDHIFDADKKNKKIDIFLSPFISMLQTIPNISWILLAIIWFGLNSKIVIFTIFISILPIFVINSREGINNTSKEYLEMAAVYQLKPLTIFTKIYIYSIKPYLRSAAVITGERAWKIGAMAELLSLDTGIGAGLYWARNNLQTERIFAWTIVLVVLGFASSQFLKIILSD